MKTNPKVILTCRTCLEMNKTYVNMFKHHEREKLLSELLRECVPIQVEQSDGLPTHMCTNCAEKLCIVWDFKSMAMVSNLKLQMRRRIALALVPTDNTDKGNESRSEDSKNITSECIIKEETSTENVDVILSPAVADVIPTAEDNYNMPEAVEQNDLSKTIIECEPNISDEDNKFPDDSIDTISENTEINFVDSEKIITDKESE
ncbi:Zinc-finger associated domain (zf-AD) [Popillia japonica]|uniref:Zinc-finger associated domain (Zf-AD) n=1 Tax=Popillia japonica TaxID=7064 RepID=A0AAW1KIB1_POPJA